MWRIKYMEYGCEYLQEEINLDELLREFIGAVKYKNIKPDGITIYDLNGDRTKTIDIQEVLLKIGNENKWYVNDKNLIWDVEELLI